jgi:very-short-patch-repair endonuclease
MASRHARALRANQTEAEARLWRMLRDRRLAGAKFRRQAPVGPYIADFVCLAAKPIVELDGGQHAENAEADASRTAWLEDRGFRVLRFWNNDALANTDGVLEEVLAALRGE